MRATRVILLALLAGCLLAACGGSGDESAKGPPGSPSNPLQALPNPTGTRTPPVADPANESTRGSQSAQAERAASKSTRTQQGTVDRKPPASVTGKAGSAAAATRPKTERKQKALAASASRPCSLVTRTQAKAIVGAPVREPIQAPQGPTCIYQATTGKAYVTLAVQTVDFAQLRRQIRDERAVSIAYRTAYCGTYGKPMLFLPVTGGRVLSITAPCSMAQRFAAKAAPHL